MKHIGKIITAVFLLIAITACSNDSEDSTVKTNEETQLDIEVTDEEILNDEVEVVLINGKAVKGDKYNHIYPQIKAQATQTGEEVDQEALKDRTIEALIERELIMQEAENEGVVATSEDVTKEFDTIKTANEEGLDTILEQFHLTEEAFKEQLKFEITLQNYTETMEEVDVSEEEMEEYYSLLEEENEDLPDYEELKGDIEAQIKQQKSLQEIQDMMIEKKESAEIERKI